MKHRMEIALLVLLGISLSAAIFVPVLSGPASRCGGDTLCIPDQKQSLSLTYLGFGAESSYGGRFYYFCTSSGCSDSWTGP
jgi:hypothetical protein